MLYRLSYKGTPRPSTTNSNFFQIEFQVLQTLPNVSYFASMNRWLIPSIASDKLSLRLSRLLPATEINYQLLLFAVLYASYLQLLFASIVLLAAISPVQPVDLARAYLDH